jgi:hypothetical protein
VGRDEQRREDPDMHDRLHVGTFRRSNPFPQAKAANPASNRASRRAAFQAAPETHPVESAAAGGRLQKICGLGRI